MNNKHVIAALVLFSELSLRACSLSATQTIPEPQYDLLILNGRIVDGTGSTPFDADVAILKDSIVRIARLSSYERSRSRRVIDASGMVVSPGFIDIHSHSDYSLLVDGTAQSKIRQGVTTEILGEADSAGPIQGQLKPSPPYGLRVDWSTLGGYFERLEKQGTSVNVGSFVGATQVRRCVIGEDSRAPSREELDK